VETGWKRAKPKHSGRLGAKIARTMQAQANSSKSPPQRPIKLEKDALSVA
jgi:hypothetical protein